MIGKLIDDMRIPWGLWHENGSLSVGSIIPKRIHRPERCLLLIDGSERIPLLYSCIMLLRRVVLTGAAELCPDWKMGIEMITSQRML